MKKILFACLVALAATACKKDDAVKETTAADGKYLKKVNYWTVSSNAEATIRELILDASGNLTGVKTFSTNGNVLLEYTSVEKNSTGQITKVSGQDKQQNKAIVYEFTYDANGNITKGTYKQDGANYRVVNYSYDSSNRLVKAEEFSASNQLVLVNTYTYAGTSENPSGYTSDQKSFNVVSTYTLKFDDKKNPSQAAPKVFYYMSLGDFYKNNVIESTEGATTTKSTLTYTASGYAASTTNGSGSGLKFVYGN